MKYVKILFAIALVFTMCSAFSLKKDHSKPVYAFGISASFTDTVVYFTDIQIVRRLAKKGSWLIVNYIVISWKIIWRITNCSRIVHVWFTSRKTERSWKKKQRRFWINIRRIIEWRYRELIQINSALRNRKSNKQ